MRKENIRIYYQNYPRSYWDLTWDDKFTGKKTRIVSEYKQMLRCPACDVWSMEYGKKSNCDYCNDLGFVSKRKFYDYELREGEFPW